MRRSWQENQIFHSLQVQKIHSVFSLETHTHTYTPHPHTHERERERERERESNNPCPFEMTHKPSAIPINDDIDAYDSEGMNNSNFNVL